MLKPWLSLFALAFLASCSVQLPNITACSTAEMTSGADCAETNTGKTSELTLDEWIDFLEPQVEPKRAGAICMSSLDYSRIKTAIEQACEKAGKWCSIEAAAKIETAGEHVASLQNRVMARRIKRDASKNADRVRKASSAVN